MKMKKIWAILLAAIMLVSCFPALSEGPDESEGVRTNVQLIRGVDIQEELKEDPEGTAEGYLYTLADDSGTILQSLDFKSITVKTGSIHVIVNEKTYISMEAGTSLSYADNAITLKGGTATVSTKGIESVDRLELAENIKTLLNQVNIRATNGPAIRIGPGEKAEIQSVSDSNMLEGSNNSAGIEVSWERTGGVPLAELVLSGNGKIEAIGGTNSAGIGGSNSIGYYGNIVINSGTIIAKGNGGAAGIGSANAPYANGSYKAPINEFGCITINDGTVKAYGGESGNGGAGIGGGNHADAKIVINGGYIEARANGGNGAGIGNSIGSSKNKGDVGDKGPGYYFVDIEINGGTIEAYGGSYNSAGIGGGMYCDAIVSITGGDITATGGAGNNNYHHGAAGIGGGYEGHAQVTISGGTINATGGGTAAGIGSGGSPNGKEDRGITGRGDAALLSGTTVTISGGTVKAKAGERGGAGIGGGDGADNVYVAISGGKIIAEGSRSSEADKKGGAGIGSGYNSVNESGEGKYIVDTDVTVNISEGTVISTGGWGAAGIGSGASNVMAESISITGGNVQAYADGTKFAIDTRILNSDGSTTSKTEGRNISVPVLQGTFVHSYTLEGGIEQNPEGLNSIVLEKDSTGEPAETLTRMPDGYRSFAATVPSAGVYNVYTDAASIGDGGGRYFAEAKKDNYYESKEEQGLDSIIQYTVAGNSLSDNFYLYPVKTFVVEKKMASETEGDSLSDINTTAYFNLVIDDTQEVYDTASITITNGAPQGRAYFVNVPDNNYEIWEVDGNGKNPVGQKFGTHILTKITTADSSEGESNDGSISPDKWTDKVAVINTYGSNIIDIDVTKVWSDSDNQDGIRSDSVTIQLLANGTDMADRTMTLSAANNWTDTFTGLERQDDEGKEIVYTIRENTIAGYTAAITGTAAEGFTVTNTHVPATTEVAVTKAWIDSDNQDGIRPESVTVRLLADGKETQNATLSAENNWNHTFTGLPVNNAGKAIAYTITEDAVTGYTTEITGTAAAGFTVTNTHVPATTEVAVTKAWSDNNDQDGIRPANVTIRLLADGTEVRNAVLSGGESGWSHTFTELPLNNAGQAITYTITEDAVTGYTTAITGTAAAGFTVTNTHTPDTTEVKVTKVWDDSDNQDAVRPPRITVRLLADGTEIQREILNPSNNWSCTFADLPVNSAGQAIAYTVTEDEVTGYTTAITGTAAAGFTVTNTHTPDTTEVTVTKVWNDNSNQDGVRPENVTIRLLANGEEVRNAEITGTGDSWTYTFADLPRNSTGRAITYTITEDTVTGYTTAITGRAAAGFTVTNTHTPDTTEVTVTKVWDDNSNQDGVRPENVTIRLLANGTEARSAEITGTGESWSYTFTDLPRNSAGRAITYTIAEDTVTGYTTAITGTAATGFTVTNTHTPDTTEVTVTKAWNDNSNQDGVRPENVTIRLLANGTEVRSAEITGTGDSWTYTFADLPRNSAGRAITYTIAEDTVTGYTTAITGTAAAGFTVTNTHEPAVIQVTVAKVWNDNNNQDGIRPAAVTVNLMANGTQVRTQRVTGNGNRWTYTFTDLPQFENGTEIVYTVNENAVTGYTAAITGTAAAGFTLTNTHAPEVISVSGRKTWADQNNTDGIRPASITVHLLADGRQTETRTVTDDTYMFENLPRFINGREIVYSISEDPVEGYTTEINGYDLTNRHTPLRISVNGAKVWGDHENREGLRPQAITVHLLADGQEVGTQQVTGMGDRWTYSFTNLPGYSEGKLIQYTVTEDAVEGYETTVVGHEIYNIHRNEDPQEDPELYTLTVRYWADGQTAFPDFRGTYEFGAMYSVVSPEKPGYTVDLEVVAGVIVEDTVIDVYYTPKPVTLTIYYQYMDGSIAADTYFDTLMPGVPYDVVSPVIEGYTATQLRVEGTMPNRNVEFVVWYLPEAEPDPDTGRTRIPGGYTKIDEYGVPLGLGEVNRNAGECYE